MAKHKEVSKPDSTVRFGIQARFLGVALVATLSTLGLLAAALSQQWRGQQELAEIGRDGMRQMVELGIRQRGEALAMQLADTLANPLYYFDLHSVGEIARTALKQPDVAYVLVFDPEGRIIHDGSGDIPTFGQPMNDEFAGEAIAASSLHVQQSVDLLEVAVPIRIGDQLQGGARVGISLREPMRRQELALDAMTTRSRAIAVDSLILMSLLFAGLLAIAAVLSLMVSRGLVRPIRRLAEAAKQVEAGVYQIDLPSLRGDELGELQRGFLRMAAGIARHEEEVSRLAYSDHLTGLPNRLAFREKLDLCLISAHAEGASVALVCIDLDDFKRVNDTLGHDAGDEVLEQFATRLRQCIPFESDQHAQAARFGGDEFVAVVGGVNARGAAHQLAEAVLNELQKPLVVRGRQVYLGASVGITVFPEDAQQARDLIKNGDIAMYQAKSAGKNCLRFYSRAMDQAVGNSVAMQDALRGAWDRGELSVCYQPIFALADHQLVGAEALLRWNHPTLGEVAPTAFIEIAEQSGLIEPIGRHVLLAACEAAQRWAALSQRKNEGGDAPFVSVNVSARQLRSGELPELVASVLQQTGLEPACLHLELTETAVLGDEIHASVQLARLRASGVKVWLDDFGTGFSGLSHLRRVPVDGLKIDKSFVSDVLQDPDDLALTSAIIAMGHSLGITVVAEGIESQAQFAILRERGCDYGQGFWLGHPMPEAALREQMAN